MRYIASILFILCFFCCKAQYCVQVIGDSVIGYHAIGVCPTINYGIGYDIPFNFDLTDIYGNSKYVFKPLTPPNFTANDIILNPATRARFVSDSLATTQKAQLITSLKSSGYKSLQGVTVGATLTSAQLQAAAWISLYNSGAVNPATNKIDSMLNYIK